MMKNIELSSIESVVRALEDAGIGFVVDSYLGLTGDKIPEFLADPDAFLARAYGVSKEAYIDYTNGVPLRCTGKTTSGRRCRNEIPGSTNADYDVKEYARLRGGYCWLHGG